MKHWNEIGYKKVRTFQFENEPELIYIIPIGAEGYNAVVHDDAYDLDAGKVEIMNNVQLKEKYGIEL